jgi:type IV pilus assembly protein PilY1
MKKRRIVLTLMAMVLLSGSPVYADDLLIYGQAAEGVTPNCLILFDTSGSMDSEDVQLEAYDYETSYSGDLDYLGWYYTVISSESYWNSYCHWSFWSGWSGCWDTRSVSTNVSGGAADEIACDDITNDLNATGQFTDDWCLPTGDTTGGPVCTNSAGGCDDGYSLQSATLYSGNYLNYEAKDVTWDNKQMRIAAARDVVTTLLNDNYTKANFGLMRFTGSTSGKILEPCGALQADLIQAVSELTPDDYTPLAEALAEAGRYFAGMASWYGKTYSDADIYTDGHYVSPIEYSCQQNHVIILTDGQPYSDGYKISDHIANYMDGKPIGGTQDLPAVAGFLHETDLSSTYPEYQNIITHTIAFGESLSLASARTFLEQTAAAGKGTSSSATTTTSLLNAFDTIMDNMLKEVSIFVAPVVPVNKTRHSSDSDLIYLAFFKPQSSGGWKGNIKKYNLVTKENCNDGGRDLCDEIGEIYDVNWNSAITANGTLEPTAIDYWNTDADNVTGAIDEGGVGDKLTQMENNSRKLYTYLDKCFNSATGTVDTLTTKLLTADSNSFSTSNDCLEASPYNLTDIQITQTHRNSEAWKMGDIVHSEPVVVNYQDDDKTTVIFAGSNDASFHCFADSNGEELWGFVPPDQFSRLDLIDDSIHQAFIDGGITATLTDPQLVSGAIVEPSPRTVVFGERRGGTSYFALNISSLAAPQYKHEIAKDYFKDYNSESYEELGQSWGRPVAGKVSTGIDSDTGNAIKKDAFVLTGGYDVGQDEADPSADNTGRVVFIVDELTGDLIYGLGNMTLPEGSTANFRTVSDMHYCVTDVLATYGTTYSGVNADIINRLYFGDLGGNVFAAADDLDGTTKKLADGTWPNYKQIFAGATDVKRKILYAPTMTTRANDGVEVVLFGTGDREDPNDESVLNRFYCVVNDWASTTVLDDDDLADVTDADDDGKRVANSNGWRIDLATGEKVISKPILYGDAVIFTTYTPPDDTAVVDDSDPCNTGAARGSGKAYIISIYNADAVVEDDLGLNTDDNRIFDLPSSLPMGQPMLDGDVVRIGTTFLKLGLKKHNDYFYWRQQ